MRTVREIRIFCNLLAGYEDTRKGKGSPCIVIDITIYHLGQVRLSCRLMNETRRQLDTRIAGKL